MEIKVTCENRRAEVFLKGELDHHGARTAIREIELAIDASLPKILVCRPSRTISGNNVKI